MPAPATVQASLAAGGRQSRGAVVTRAVRVLTTLPCALTSARKARRWLAEACDVLGVAEDCGTISLLGSELVTNAVLHGRSEVTVVLEAAVEDAVVMLRVEVRDDNSQLPRFEQRDELALGGRGLVLVSELADRYGVDSDEWGKGVWFELASAREPGHGRLDLSRLDPVGMSS
jgi:anti-sigma regulatory factor (Ser/Thr protein kinase)